MQKRKGVVLECLRCMCMIFPLSHINQSKSLKHLSGRRLGPFDVQDVLWHKTPKGGRATRVSARYAAINIRIPHYSGCTHGKCEVVPTHVELVTSRALRPRRGGCKYTSCLVEFRIRPDWRFYRLIRIVQFVHVCLRCTFIGSCWLLLISVFYV